MGVSNTTYKQTELGLIPQDWEVLPLSQLFVFKNGLNKEKQFFGFGSPIINYMDVYRNNELVENKINGLVSVTKNEIINFGVKKGDVFFTRTSETIEEIGVSAVLLENIKNAVFSGFVLRARPINSKLEPLFCKYCFSTSIVRKEITSKSSYTTRALTSGTSLSKVFITVPPLAEQTAIANALSDVDNLIETLEKLIAKKKLIKQGALQKLLKPKKGWVNKRLGDIGVCIRGVTYSTNQHLSKTENVDTIRLLRSNNIRDNQINKDDLQFIDVRVVKKHQVLENHDIVICMANGSKDLVGKAGLFLNSDGGQYSFGSFMSCFRITSNECTRFIYYQFLSDSYRNYIDVLLSGSSINNLKPSDIESILISLPSIEEQEKIADILTDMDNEIEFLQDKLKKYQQVKQGMVQNLLTGKIRLLEQPSITKRVSKVIRINQEWVEKESSILAMIVSVMEIPIGHFRYQKYMYLFHRHSDGQVEGFKKFAAGPFNKALRYDGPEDFIREQEWSNVKILKNGNPRFTEGKYIDEARTEFLKYYGMDNLKWLLNNFKFLTDDELELYTTVDMAIVDLKRDNKQIDILNVKKIIKDTPEWTKKLQKSIFNNTSLQRAIDKSLNLFYNNR